jgi:hypothetical protein
MSYTITTLCAGGKYEPIKNHWLNRIHNRCKNHEIVIFDNFYILHNSAFESNYSGYTWAVRFKHNLDLLLKTQKTIVMCDLDVIIEKDIQPLVDLSYDIIVSTEIGGAKAYPKECSEKLGFGVCCGFMVVKPSATKTMLEIFKNMQAKKYNTYDDQVNLMNYIVNHNYTVSDEEIVLDGIQYTNKIIDIDNIKICVLDFNIITRDPVTQNGQFGNHINIDNVGGTSNFLKYFYEPLENLPLTCRCGKTHLGDYNICPHITLRGKK